MTHTDHAKYQALRWLNSALATLWHKRHEDQAHRANITLAVRNYRRVNRGA